MTNTKTRREALALLAGAGLIGFGQPALAAKQPKPPPVPLTPVVAVVAEVQGNGFYEASRDGAQEALTEIGGGINLSYVGPATADARQQIEAVNDLIKQKVSAIVIAPVDATTLAPVLRRAMVRGIKVVSFEKPLAKEGRHLQLDATTVAGTAQSFLKMMAASLKDGGEVAVIMGERRLDDEKNLVSALIREWIKPDYAQLKLAETLYGNDDDAKAYTAAEGLINDHPRLRGIIAAHPAILTAAARAVADRGLSGKVFVTGFGQPSQLQAGVTAGVVESFAIANPVDLGYAATRLAVALVNKEVTGRPGEIVNGGRLGQITIGDGNVAVLGQPFVVEKSNFDKYAKMF